ncbi:hypothetical protein ACVXZY_16320 [Staphylococcus aureus]
MSICLYFVTLSVTNLLLTLFVFFNFNFLLGVYCTKIS